MYGLAVSTSMSQYMRKLLVKPTEPLVHTHVLVWEAPPSQSSPNEDWAPTDAGLKSRPSAADPLVFLVEKVAGRANPFAMGVTVGRVETNDIIVDDGSVSRFHAWLQYDARQKQWWLCDAESKNGTFLGAQQLKPNQKVPLNAGDRVKFGDASMVFLSPEGLVKAIQERGSASNR